MSLFLDAGVNTFHKGFLTSPQSRSEDPTYLGFSFVFDFDPVHRSFETGLTKSPLFAKPRGGLESAEEYLSFIGYNERSRMVAAFKDLLSSINTDTPYYFQSLDGLADLWKIDKKKEFNSFRGNKILTIACLEGIDMKITALADLYRKMTFDAYHMRELLPENLRWFDMDIRVAEMRKFHKIVEVATSSTNTAQVNENANTGTFNHRSEEYQKQFQKVDNLISAITFRLEHCEFDFEDSFPAEDALSVGGDLVMAKQKIKINVGRITELNQFKLLDLILQDDFSNRGGERSQVRAITGSNTTDNRKVIPDFDNALNKSSAFNPLTARANEPLGNALSKSTFNPLTARANELQSELARKLERAGSDLIARGVNAVKAKITGAVLGNVHDLRNQSLGTIVGGFVGPKEHAELLGKENVFAGQATTVPSPTSSLGNAIK